MKRSGLLLPFLLVLSTSFVSAAFDNFSLEGFIYSVGGVSTVVYFSLFMIFFGILYFSLLRAFGYNKPLATIVSFGSTILILIGFYRMNWDFESFFYGLSVSPEIITSLIYLVSIIGLIFLIKKFKFAGTLMIMGLLLLAISNTDLIYESTTGSMLGIFLFLFGLWRSRKNRKPPFATAIEGNSDYDDPKSPSKWKERREERKNQKHQQRLAEKQSNWERAQREDEIKRRAGNIAEIRKRREAQEAQKEAERKKQEAEQEAARQKEIRRRAKNIAKIRKEKNNHGKLRKEYDKIIKELNSMPGGKAIAKGTSGYKKLIKLQTRANEIRKILGT